MPLKAAKGLKAAIEELNDPEEDTDFVLLKYLTKKEIGLAEQGEGSIDEMVKYLEDDQLMYGLLRSDDGFSRGKVLWMGSTAGAMMKARNTMDKNAISDILGQYHFSFKSQNGEIEELLADVASAEGGGLTQIKFTGGRTRVGAVPIPDWETAAYRAAWADVGKLDGEGGLADHWARNWYNSSKIDFAPGGEGTTPPEWVEDVETTLKLLNKVRRCIKRTPDDMFDDAMKRMVRKAANKNRDGEMVLTDEEVEYFVKAISLFEHMSQLATEPEEMTLSDGASNLVLDIGDEMSVDAPTVTPAEALEGLEFEVLPVLPTGLTLASDGRIFGTPEDASDLTEYTITASNRAGSVSCKFKITVRLPDLSEAHARTFEERDANTEESNIFCKIARGEIPGAIVYQDDNMIAFMDVNPAAKGHVLLCPVKLYQSLDVVPVELLTSMMTMLPQLAIAACHAVGAKDYNVLSNNGTAAGQTVFQTHFHIIPRMEGDSITVPWKPLTTSPEELADLADKISSDYKA